MEQPANEQAIVGLEGISSIAGKKAFAVEGKGQCS